jgi:beta-1,4-mannosyl-glycoprotein beta-1,4-N-acetylglucosaminyltransferase
MIIDCFPFFNELEILDIRLNTLSPFVDYFILVEASKTQSKLEKPFYFEENKEKFLAFSEKIIHIKIDTCPNENGWAMENFQRNAISEGIKKINLEDEDIILISDVDEIPDLSKIEPESLKEKITAFEMSYHTFYLNLLTENKNWVGTVATPWKFFKDKTPQLVRNSKDFYKRIPSGWHLGYMGGKEKVYKKFFSCIEPINKNLIIDFDSFSKEFDRKIKNNGSFFFSDKKDDSIKLKECDVTYPHLPTYIEQNKDKFKNLLFNNKIS